MGSHFGDRCHMEGACCREIVGAMHELPLHDVQWRLGSVPGREISARGRPLGSIERAGVTWKGASLGALRRGERCRRTPVGGSRSPGCWRPVVLDTLSGSSRGAGAKAECLHDVSVQMHNWMCNCTPSNGSEDHGQTQTRGYAPAPHRPIPAIRRKQTPPGSAESAPGPTSRQARSWGSRTG